MSSTIHFSLLRKPELLDLVDEEWEKDIIPEDGKRGTWNLSHFLGSLCHKPHY